VQRLNLEGRVFFHKPIALREMAKVIQTADLGVIPKRKDNFGNEAFSTKILEFMAVGVPVVSDTMVDKYYFDNSIVRFFQAGDEEDLARCLLDLARNPESRRRQAEEARFIDKNDWTSKQHEYLDLVDGIVARQASQ
jgi:glycosyltransferase involved in cell wall biosynthesis